MTQLAAVRENTFGARFYSPSLGRFLTPDWSDSPEPVPYADLSDPQSLNLYAYAGNNPVTNGDGDGHVCIFGIGNCAKKAPPANCGNPCTVTAPAPSLPLITAPSVIVFAAGAVAFNRLTATRPLTPTETRSLANMQLRVGEITPPGEALTELGEEAAAIVERALSALGNETITASSREAAEKAAQEFVGHDSEAMGQSYGNRVGNAIGRKSADGMRNFRDDGDHFNLVNKATGGNLHVRFPGGN